MRLCCLTWFTKTRSSSIPVMSWAWTIRFCEWPPSRPRSKSESGSYSRDPVGNFSLRSNRTPSSVSSRILSGPFLTTNSTTSLLQRPSPASSVSWIWRSNESSLSKTEAIPPWAILVLLSIIPFLVTRATLPNAATLRAKVRPATPLPMIKKSVLICFMWLYCFKII